MNKHSQNNKLKILLTGSDGQLGHDFQKLFDNLNINYVATDHKELNVSNDNELENFFEKNNDFTHVINCAAYNDVDKAEINNNAFLLRYAISKHEGEKAVLAAWHKSFAIRTSWLFGINGENFNTQVINWSKTRDKLSIVDDQISAPTYSKDLAEFSWKLIQTEKYGLYHITNNGIASKYEQAKYVLEKIGWKGILETAKTKDFNLPAKKPSFSKLSSEKVEKLLGKKIPDWKNGIDRYLEEMGIIKK